MASESPPVRTAGGEGAGGPETPSPVPPSPGGRRRGIVFSLAASFWAALFLIPYQAAVERADRSSVLVAMLLTAAIFNSTVVLFTERADVARFDRTRITTAGWLALATVLGNAALAVALPRIGPGMTSVLMKSQVLITPVLSWWALRERPDRSLWGGAALAMAGFALPRMIDGPGGALTGHAAALIAAVVFASMQILTRRVIHRIEPATVNALRLWMATGLLLALPAAWGGGGLDLDGTTWLLAAAAGVTGPGISRLFLMNAVRTVTASLTALVALVGPLFAFGFGYLFFNVVPTALDAAGALLILTGVLWPILAERARAADVD